MVRVASATIAAALLAALPLLAAATAKARPPLPLAPTCDTYTFSATEIDLIEDPFTRALVVFTAGDNATGRGYYIDPGTGGRRHEGSFTGASRDARSTSLPSGTSTGPPATIRARSTTTGP
jgi:hypothetical protein